MLTAEQIGIDAQRSKLDLETLIDRTHQINQAFAVYATRVAFNVTLTRHQIDVIARLLSIRDPFLGPTERIALSMKGLCVDTKLTRAGRAVAVLLEEAGLLPKLLDKFYDEELAA